MITEALKREIEVLAEIARARDIACWIDFEPKYGINYTFNYQERGKTNHKTFQHPSATLGLNRLMQVIKAYPVVS